jgi:DNA-binding SARP family transcriptional activator
MISNLTAVEPPVLVCLLGSFRVVKSGHTVNLKPGGKAESLLANLALRVRLGLPRDQVLSLLWPTSEPALASQSLNTLVYSLHRALGDALAGRPPILHQDGLYRLNAEDGVAVDITAFDAAVDDGDRATRAGDEASAFASYHGAAALYLGDLVLASDVHHVVERERLRARYLFIRAQLADHRFSRGDYAGALGSALELLAHDPCREDAHRLVMRCYNRLGQRAQALRQFRLCRDVLAAEFDAIPEPATDELYELLRTAPSRV